MLNSMRSTLTAGSRRNIAIIVSSASLAVLGVGGGAALALTSGGDHHSPRPPELPKEGSRPSDQPTTHDPGTPTPDPGTTTTPDPGTTTTPDPGPGTSPDPGPGTSPDPGTTTTPDPGPGTSPDPSTTSPGNTDTAGANLPSVQSACGGDAGTLVGQPVEGTLDDGRKYLGYVYDANGVQIVAMDIGKDDVIDMVFADVNADNTPEVQAVCGQDADWVPFQA